LTLQGLDFAQPVLQLNKAIDRAEGFALSVISSARAAHFAELLFDSLRVKIGVNRAKFIAFNSNYGSSLERDSESHVSGVVSLPGELRGTVEAWYVFVSDEQGVPMSATKERVTEIAADFVTVLSSASRRT
jgi:hypothetical protein